MDVLILKILWSIWISSNWWKKYVITQCYLEQWLRVLSVMSVYCWNGLMTLGHKARHLDRFYSSPPSYTLWGTRVRLGVFQACSKGKVFKLKSKIPTVLQSLSDSETGLDAQAVRSACSWELQFLETLGSQHGWPCNRLQGTALWCHLDPVLQWITKFCSLL